MILKMDELDSELEEIKERLVLIHDDLRRLADRPEALGRRGGRYLEVIGTSLTDEMQDGLAHAMVKGCERRDECRGRFTGFLTGGIEQVQRGDIHIQDVDNRRDQLRDMRSKAPYEKCDRCFSEVSRLFEKQVKVMRSLDLYQTEGEEMRYIDMMDDEDMVASFLEPLANRQRFQIMRAVARGPRSFSQLSGITGLKGGNLLFHLNRLMDADMLIQRHERGDYLITEKGMAILKMLIRAHLIIS